MKKLDKTPDREGGMPHRKAAAIAISTSLAERMRANDNLMKKLQALYQDQPVQVFFRENLELADEVRSSMTEEFSSATDNVIMAATRCALKKIMGAEYQRLKKEHASQTSKNRGCLIPTDRRAAGGKSPRENNGQSKEFLDSVRRGVKWDEETTKILLFALFNEPEVYGKNGYNYEHLMKEVEEKTGKAYTKVQLAHKVHSLNAKRRKFENKIRRKKRE